MTSSVIDSLLREQQALVLRDRRSCDRRPFTRPIIITTGRDDEQFSAFSRDISPNGIALIGQIDWPAGTIATLGIHSLFGPHVEVRGEVRWSQAYGAKWYLSGWHFLEKYV